MFEENLLDAPVRFDATTTYDDKIYYYEWTINGGHVTFGMHGTTIEWVRKRDGLLVAPGIEYIILHTIREIK